MLKVPPIRYPTTVVWVDDSIDFLDSIAFQMPLDLSCLSFDQPVVALKYLTAQFEARHQYDQLGHDKTVKVHFDDELTQVNQPGLLVGMDDLHRVAYNPERFAEVSVIVADYDMPEMNGLALFEQLQHLPNPTQMDAPIKRILLTGQADERVAVDAFNQGLIDSFFLKSAPNALERLMLKITQFQESYLSQRYMLLHRLLSLNVSQYLNDPVFAELVAALYKEHHFVEHYVMANPDGLLLVKANGQVSRLIVETEAGLMAHIEAAQNNGAPQSLIDALKRAECVPFFWRSGGMYGVESVFWRQDVYPAQCCKGKNWYYWALVDSPAGVYSDVLLSFNAHLALNETHK